MTPHLSALAFLCHTTSPTHLVFICPALPPVSPRHPSVALGPALCPSSPCGRLVSPPLETAYQGPHVICLQDLTDGLTSEITSYYQRRRGGGVCLSSLSGCSFLSS